MVKRLMFASMVTSIVLVLAGCDTATMSAPGNQTLGSAAVGGLGGALVGSAVTKDHGKGALVGGAIGALGGAAVGNQMERNRDRAVMQQQQVQGAYNQGYLDAQGAPPPPPPPARSY